MVVLENQLGIEGVGDWKECMCDIIVTPLPTLKGIVFMVGW
jgi:hypothetical protein